MSKVIRAVVGVAMVTVGVMTGQPQLILQGTSMTLGAVLSKGSKGNAASSQRLSKQLVPEDFRKIVFGRTAGAADLRFWEVHGSKNTTYSEVIAVAGHRIHSFQEFYAEDDAVTFSGVNATGIYANALKRRTNDGAPGNAALSVGAGSYWTSASKFTGVAHYALEWEYTEKALPNGIPQKITQVIEGALVYDPRKDSTRGGSGTHRIDDQSTWAYATLDSNGQPIGRNNALQALWYLLGWRVQNPSSGEWVLVAGQGIDPVDIDIPSFITAANDAEAQQFYTDMILSTGDSHGQNRAIITGNDSIGRFLDPGGLWTYRVTKDDTAVPAVTLTEDDVLEGTVEWVPDQPMSEQFNRVVGTYIDPSATSLYQAKAYPQVKDASYETADGFKRRTTLNFQAFQSEALAQKAGRFVLNEGRYQGEFRATFSFKALQAQLWDVVGLVLDRYGFDSTYRFRVRSMSLSPAGIEMRLRQTHASIYTAGSVTTTPAPSALAKYDTRQKVPVEGLAVSPTTLSGASGSAQDAVTVSWTAAPGNVRRTELQYKLTAGSTWTPAITMQADNNSCVIAPLMPNSAYQVRVRHVSIHEVPGDWVLLSLTTGTGGRVTSATVAYADGTSLEALKPAEAGANVTETRTAAAITGQSVWATYGTLPPSRLEGLTNGQDVYIYKRSITTPALPSASATITFSTAAVTGLTNGWTTSIPASDGNPLWISRAPAIGTGTTATILSTAWDAPRAMADDKIKTFYAAGSIIPTATKDWTFTSALPSGFTMTRSGLATRVNASGYIEDVGGNLPRFDHNPVTLAAKGLLFEEPRTNLLPFSEEAASCYSVLSAAWSSNTQTSPRNTTGADTLTAAAGLNRHIGYQSFTGTAATYAYSVFLKQGTARYVQLQLADDGAAKKYGAVLDTQTGTVTTTNSTGAPSGTSNAVENYGNGWYRLTVTMTLTASTCYAIIGISNSGTPSYDSNGNPSFTAAGTETIHAWGTQLEVGAFATSYIPNTSTGTTFRGNEYAEMSGTNFSSWFTSAQGSFFIEAESYKPSYNAAAMFVHQGSGTDASGILVAMHDLSQVIWFNSSGGIVADLDHGSTAASTYYKYAGAWANNDFASSRDGTASLTDTVGTYGTTAALLRLGMYRDNQYPLNGHVKAIKFWNTRIANAALEALSGGGTGGTGPTPSAIGDIWYNTSEGNKQYRATGLTNADWVAVQDAAIGTAQATADGKNKIFPASASAPSGAIAGDLWPDTSSSPTVTRRFDGVSTWSIVSTVGAQAGTNLYRTDGTTVMSQAEVRTPEGTAAAISGQGALATLSTVGATQVNSNAITAPYLASVGVVTLSASSGFYQTVTGLSFTATIASGEDLDVDLNLFMLWAGSDGTRFNVDAVLLRDGITVASFGTVMDTNDMATNNQGGFAIPANLSCRVAGNGASSTYSVQVQLSASVSESNSGGSKTFVAPLDIRVRQGVLRGRRYSR